MQIDVCTCHVSEKTEGNESVWLSPMESDGTVVCGGRDTDFSFQHYSFVVLEFFWMCMHWLSRFENSKINFLSFKIATFILFWKLWGLSLWEGIFVINMLFFSSLTET